MDFWRSLNQLPTWNRTITLVTVVDPVDLFASFKELLPTANMTVIRK